MTQNELILKNIHDFRYNFLKLKKMIQNGEISNSNNLNGPIFLQYTESYGEIICKYLENFINKED